MNIDINPRVPFWKHDHCEDCEYLGGLDFPDGIYYDLYKCTSEKLDVVIARYGSDSHDYMSADVTDKMYNEANGQLLLFLIAAKLGQARPPRT